MEDVANQTKQWKRLLLSVLLVLYFYYVHNTLYWGRFLNVIGTKVLRVFLLAIQSPLLMDFTPHLSPVQTKLVWNWFVRFTKSENSQDYAQKTQWNCTLMNLASGLLFRFLHYTATLFQRADSRGTPCFPASSPDPGTCFLRSSNRENFRENKKFMTFNEAVPKKRRIVAKAIKKWD
jgi:hypothetical protein